MVDTPPLPSGPRRAVAVPTGAFAPLGLLTQLCEEYPEVSVGAVADVLDLVRVAASEHGGAEISRGGMAALARDRLAVIRIRAAAAGRRAGHVPHPEGLSRFDRLFDVVMADAGQSAVSANSLCRTAAARLDVAAVAVSVPDGLVAAQTVGAAGDLARRLEELQVVLGEGPSIDGLAGGRNVLVDDLSTATQQARWPVFAPQALGAGVASVYVLPMRVGAARFGVLVAYLDRPGGLGAEALAETRCFAAIALELLLDRAAAGAPGGGTADIDSDPMATGRRFFDDRPEIHQATGMVSVQLDVDLATALLRIRARAFAEGRSLTDLAVDVVARNVFFDRDDQ